MSLVSLCQKWTTITIISPPSPPYIYLCVSMYVSKYMYAHTHKHTNTQTYMEDSDYSSIFLKVLFYNTQA